MATPPTRPPPQVWELDRALLQAHAAPLVAAYAAETGTTLRALDGGEMLPPAAGGAGGRAAGFRVPRRVQRAGR